MNGIKMNLRHIIVGLRGNDAALRKNIYFV